MPNRMEELASEGMGKLKDAKAAMTGLKGVFRTLAEQHGQVSALLERGKTTEDPGKRRDLWKQVRTELLSHERAEMREVYPVLRKYPETAPLADHHDQEAKEAESMILRLDGIKTDSSEWGTLFGKLADAVLHHAKEEESDIFPKAQAVIGTTEAERLDSAFKETQQQIKKQL